MIHLSRCGFCFYPTVYPDPSKFILTRLAVVIHPNRNTALAPVCHSMLSLCRQGPTGCEGWLQILLFVQCCDAGDDITRLEKMPRRQRPLAACPDRACKHRVLG